MRTFESYCCCFNNISRYRGWELNASNAESKKAQAPRAIESDGNSSGQWQSNLPRTEPHMMCCSQDLSRNVCISHDSPSESVERTALEEVALWWLVACRLALCPFPSSIVPDHTTSHHIYAINPCAWIIALFGHFSASSIHLQPYCFIFWPVLITLILVSTFLCITAHIVCQPMSTASLQNKLTTRFIVV